MEAKFKSIEMPHESIVYYEDSKGITHTAKTIASLLHMTKEEYTKLAFEHRAIYNNYMEITFSNIHDACLFAEYLNDVYMVSLKLRGLM